MNKKMLLIVSAALVTLLFVFIVFRIFSAARITGTAISRPGLGENMLNEAEGLTKAGRENEAIKKLEILCFKYPESDEARQAFIKIASIYEKRQELLKARDFYQKAIENFPTSTDILKLQEALDNLNIKILFSPNVTPDSFVYEVQKGDTLARIAKKYNTTMELIRKANNLPGTSVNLGEKLKIQKSKFSILVNKEHNMLMLKSDGNIIKVYRVATGKNNSTPAGTFKIVNRIVNPPWYKNNKVIPAGSPENILGSRWMGISKKGYGIHGTTSPQAIGTQITAGCVRMKNQDVEELFAIVPEGTEVTITD